MTVTLITCCYKEKEFIRVGYYVNNEHNDPAINAEIQVRFFFHPLREKAVCCARYLAVEEPVFPASWFPFVTPPLPPLCCLVSLFEACEAKTDETWKTIQQHATRLHEAARAARFRRASG